jgi:transposase-like protein
MNLPDLIERFGSDEKCRAYLEELRWPSGVECPRCGGTTISRIVKRHQFDCDSCRYQFSVTAGTLFHDSHLPLWKWFLAIYLMGESKKGISAKQLQRTLGVSYKTAWYLAHRIRDAMGEDDQPLLRGIVEADETFHGGKQTGRGRGPYQKGSNKTMIMGVVERDGEVRLKIGHRPTSKELKGFLREHVADDAKAIYTDDHRAYVGIADANTIHETVRHFRHEYVRGDVHTNTIEGVWSLFKRSVIGSFHQVSVKHLPAYLDELEFRFNNRQNPFLFRDTLMVLLKGDALPYKELVGHPSAS